MLFRSIKSGSVELESRCGVHRLQETWDEKCGLVEEYNFISLEARGGDRIKKYLQVSANTLVGETVKVGKCDRHDCLGMRELSRFIMVVNRE